ncbi:MAG: 2-amino-4-hydroxy-6-hydroxymethyldihydropteridine pyrophosphokinae [Frankiales bacterium]|nr:2-amino-4-hydroxy-6-hydroxymethyldihydropteridine pyrophosphokinae [Frankiales bacterium]
MSAVVSIGSNLGDRLAHLQSAVEVLGPTAISSVVETRPVGGPAQRDYLNAVLLCPTDAATTWRRAQRAELARGRARTVRWGPRTLDVDIVVADGTPPEGVVLPHPRAHERVFVLLPWLELDPDAVLAGYGPVAQLVAAMDVGGVDRRPDLQLVPAGSGAAARRES